MSNATANTPDFITFDATIITEHKWAGGIFPGADGGLKACIGDLIDFDDLRACIESGAELPTGEDIAGEIASEKWGAPDAPYYDAPVEGFTVTFAKVARLAQDIIDDFAAEVAEEMADDGEDDCLDLDFLTDGDDGFYYYRADELGCDARVPADEVNGSEFADYDDFCQNTTCEVLRDGEWVAHEGC